eukprot:3336631-Rhodomonas_salina.4
MRLSELENTLFSRACVPAQNAVVWHSSSLSLLSASARESEDPSESFSQERRPEYPDTHVTTTWHDYLSHITGREVTAVADATVDGNATFLHP